jgi:H+/Cl- antiporter ClcA
LVAEQAAANLLGGIGSGLLGGLFSPIATQGGGVGSLFGGVLEGLGGLFGGNDDDSGSSGSGGIGTGAP